MDSKNPVVVTAAISVGVSKQIQSGPRGILGFSGIGGGTSIMADRYSTIPPPAIRKSTITGFEEVILTIPISGDKRLVRVEVGLTE